jgi:hypothetical protein
VGDDAELRNRLDALLAAYHQPPGHWIDPWARIPWPPRPPTPPDPSPRRHREIPRSAAPP